MADPRVRRSFMWVAVLVLGMLIGSVLMGTAGAQPGPPGDPGAPDGLEVREQNLDGAGNIKVHEQGVVDVKVAGTPTVKADPSGTRLRSGSANIFLFFEDTQDLEVPAGVVLTDLVVSHLFSNTDCEMRIWSGSPWDGEMLFEGFVLTDPALRVEGFASGAPQVLHLTTGLAGPLTIRWTADVGGLGDPICEARVFWTGYGL